MKLSNLKQWKFSLVLVGCVWITWLSLLGPSQAFAIMVENWQIALAMIFGSLVGGGTSEGGGSVAFPVMTKVLHFLPFNAAIFSLAIQSVGMTSASIAIVLMRAPVEWRTVLWAGIGGVIGIVGGVWFLAPIVPPDVTRVVFTAIVGSLALMLVLLNRSNRIRNVRILTIGIKEKSLLLLTGLIGGVITSLVGTGIDIVVFSLIVLLFRVNEKIATPTTVVLQSLIVIVGFVFHAFVMHDIVEVVYHSWFAAIPVVVVGAPLGAMLCARMSRESIVSVVLALICIEIVSTLIIIPFRPFLGLVGIGSFILLSTVYYLLYRAGFRSLLSHNTQKLSSMSLTEIC